MIMLGLRYIGLFLATALGGMLSGFMWMVPNGLMGGALGISLSVGTLWLGLKQARGANPPTRRYVLIIGAMVGLLGGIAMAAISALCAGIERHEFGPPILRPWAPLGMGLLYGIALTWCYHGRLSSKRPLGSTVFRACALCFLLKAAATFVYLAVTGKSGANPGHFIPGSIIMALLGAVPFAFLWVLATALLDPAWAPQAQLELRRTPSLRC